MIELGFWCYFLMVFRKIGDIIDLEGIVGEIWKLEGFDIVIIKIRKYELIRVFV